jgi:hypothetical protein
MFAGAFGAGVSFWASGAFSFGRRAYSAFLAFAAAFLAAFSRARCSFVSSSIDGGEGSSSMLERKGVHLLLERKGVHLLLGRKGDSCATFEGPFSSAEAATGAVASAIFEIVTAVECEVLGCECE